MNQGREQSAAWLPAAMTRMPDARVLTMLTLLGFAIRLYLSLTSFCISGDGMSFVWIAMEYGAGNSAKAVASVFSPAYPWMIAQMHRAIPDWELAGNLVSTLMGTATIPLLYALMLEVFERREIAIGSAALAALHPAMANYSANVRTEAGFVCLMAASLWLTIRAIKRARIASLGLGGAVAGAGYLYRPEAIGFPLVVVLFLLVGAWRWRQWGFSAAFVFGAAYLTGFALVGSPYLLVQHSRTGIWTISGELNFAILDDLQARSNTLIAAQAQSLGGAPHLLTPLLMNPAAYLWHSAGELMMSLRYFELAAGLLPFTLLIVGLWRRGRSSLANWPEALLATISIFYFFGLALIYTGPRFMFHIFAWTIGWIMVGLEAISTRLAMIDSRIFHRLPTWMPALILVFAMLPETMWPIGYDMRGFRDAARDLDNRDPCPKTIIASDRRAAFYAEAGFVGLPKAPPQDQACGWIEAQSAATYLILSHRDERSWGDMREQACVAFIRRYPGAGARYYDLFAIRR
jgi:hypothetical protein